MPVLGLEMVERSYEKIGNRITENKMRKAPHLVRMGAGASFIGRHTKHLGEEQFLFSGFRSDVVKQSFFYYI